MLGLFAVSLPELHGRCSDNPGEESREIRVVVETEFESDLSDLFVGVDEQAFGAKQHFVLNVLPDIEPGNRFYRFVQIARREVQPRSIVRRLPAVAQIVAQEPGKSQRDLRLSSAARVENTGRLFDRLRDDPDRGRSQGPYDLFCRVVRRIGDPT